MFACPPVHLVVEHSVAPETFYKTIEHTADIGVEIESPDREGIFTRAGLAMFDLMFGLESVGQTDRIPISVSADNLEELLVAWLNELLYVYSVNKVVFAGFAEADLGDTSFSAVALGEALNPSKHSVDVDIKAATYHQLLFREEAGRWKARIIFDV